VLARFLTAASVAKAISGATCCVALVVAIGGVAKGIGTAANGVALVVAIGGIAEGISTPANYTPVAVACDAVAKRIGGGAAAAFAITANSVAKGICLATQLSLHQFCA